MNRELDEITGLLFPLVSECVFGTEHNLPEQDELSGKLPALYRLSKKHDIAHLVACSLKKRGMLSQEDISQKLNQQLMLAVLRCEKIQRDTDAVCRLLEAEKIDFILLKGTVLREYYPEPWMRTSSDVDILIHPEDSRRATAALTEKLSYESERNVDYEISFYSPGKVHFELHHDLREKETVACTQQLLQQVWEYVIPQEGWQHQYRMQNEFFYFYHLAHMAKHMVFGGTGIRSFIDIQIMEDKMEFDRERQEQLLQSGGLRKFYEFCTRLCAVWFGNRPHDDTTRMGQRYILLGGIYGNRENRIAVYQSRDGGKIAYAMKRIFPSQREMKLLYPVLQKHPVLTPVCHACRWCRLVFGGRLRSAAQEFKINAQTGQEVQTATKLFDEIGL